MINKQGLWFLTLISLVLVLSIYYITMPNELLLTNNQRYMDDKNKTDDKITNVEIIESDYLASLRVSALDKVMSNIKDLHLVLTNIETTIEEKNNAYEQIKYLNIIKGQEEKLEKKIKDEIKKDVFVKIENSHIKVVVACKNHNYSLANDIMRSIQAEFDTKMYISVKFKG